MRSSFLTGLAFATATVLGTGVALAGPLPAGGGPIQTTETSWESLVQKPGDILNGIVNLTSITGSQGVSFTSGQGGVFIAGAFENFVLQAVVPNQAVNPTSFSLAFSGGSLKYWTYAADPFATNVLFNGGLSQATAIQDLKTGGNGVLAPTSLWLSLAPEAICPNAACPAGSNSSTTLLITINASDITNFTSASTDQVYLDIIGGAAANAFVKDTITNSFVIANGPADASYQGTANSHCFQSSTWGVCGTNNLDATAIPEPVTLSLFGAGLAGAAAIRRRKAKKA
jgi:PEP-CTERM motif